MPKFRVSCYYQVARDFVIEADTEENAIDLVCNQNKGIQIFEEDQDMVDQFVREKLSDEAYALCIEATKQEVA
jgi:hypothetical protein